MPPQIATILCIIFILYLYRMEFKHESNVSSAIWIPLIWFAIIGSRDVSQWWYLDTVDTQEFLTLITAGNDIDRNVFLILELAGLLVITKRD